MTFSDAIKNRALLYPSLGVLAVLLGIIVFSVGRNYTILTVNGASVSSTRFNKDYKAVRVYYQNLKSTYASSNTSAAADGSASGSPEFADLTDSQLKAAALTQLVEVLLAHDGARKEVGDGLDEMVQERIDQYAKDSDLTNAARTLYGVSEQDFVDEILVPQAEADILRGRLFLKGQAFDDWMKEQKKSAEVRIFSDQFVWDGEKVAPQPRD